MPPPGIVKRGKWLERKTGAPVAVKLLKQVYNRWRATPPKPPRDRGSVFILSSPESIQFLL